MRRGLTFAAAGFVAIAVVGVVAIRRGETAPDLAERDPTPPRYSNVAPIFDKHCSQCHDRRKPTALAGPMRVFEMSSYPFATERPATLLVDLRKMFQHRGSPSAGEKRLGTAWIDGGGLDADGRAPRWR